MGLPEVQQPRPGTVWRVPVAANTGGGPNNDPNAAYTGYDLVLSITRASKVPPDPYGG